MAAQRHRDLRQRSRRLLAPKDAMLSTARTDISPHHPDEILDGRDSLRLVKLRLALTLIAVAILPIAAVAPLARAVLDDTRLGLEQRLLAEAEHASAQVRRELGTIRDTLVGLAASEGAVAAATLATGDPAAAAGAAAATDGLERLLERSSDVAIAAAVSDATGAVRARAGAPDAAFAGLPPPPGVEAVFRLVPHLAGSTARLEITAAIPGAADGPPAGSIAVAVSVPDLLRWAIPDAVAGRTVDLIDASGRVIASVGQGGALGLPETVIDLAANTSEATEGLAEVGVPGLAGWRIAASAPLPVTAIPFPAVAALAGLVILLIGFTWWMARQILRPAAELDARRARLHELYESARDAALRDSLTGLGNHRAFQEAVARTVDQARRYGTPFSLVLLDIDEFKRINDTRGHATGDELLAEVGNLIRSTVRQADAGFRIGGDEFALLLPSTDRDGAEATARRLLLRGLEDRPGGRYRGQISFSAGVTACPEFGRTRVELTAQADAALYRGKRSGRTVVTVFDPALDRGHVDEGMRAELAAAVSVVIETGSLSPVYQPIVHLTTGRILGYEGLVRVGPDAGFQHTGALFDAAEVAGRVLDLDRAALDVVLRGAHRIPAPTLLSLNVSPRSFEVPEFNATVFLSILRRHGIGPERVLLELTERDSIRDPERLRTAILQLQEAGVRVAADDVGAGNAGLRLLSQFRFDVVKIDLSLVQGGASQGQTLSVLTSLVQLARRWGALTIAEGVETAAQLQMIRQLEVDAGQGYLLGRPGAVLDATFVDLDGLAGGPAPSAPMELVPVAATFGGGAAATRSGTMLATLTAPVATQRPMPVLTAASIIADGAPNPFARSGS
ncbi:MAG TPA: EAL domain-containing protein [Candidatus Limnocylindrales bacterium]|nr:EAL domain-containing protein [Candidatus Limnocylindrales bacterium]